MDKYLTLRKDAEQFKNIESREVILRTPSVKEDSRSIRGVVATELPVVVMDWYRWEPIREVLIIDGGNIPEKIPLLDAHSRFEVVNIKGRTTNFDYEADPELGMILVGDNIFSKTAETEFTLAKEGNLDSTSIGYRVYENQSVTVQPGMEMEVDGRKFRNDYEDKLPLVIRKKWDLMENSLVPIGADKAAKFRSLFHNNESDIELEQKTVLEGIREANEKLDSKLKIIINKEGQAKMDEEKKLAEQQRVQSIDALAVEFKDKVKNLDLMQLKELYKSGNRSVDEFSNKILENIEKQTSVAKPTIELTPKEVQRYSISRAIAHLADPSLGNCFEFEVSKEFQNKTGVKSGGFVVPHNYLAKRLSQRVVNSTATTGGDFIPTDHLAGEWIDVLRNETIAAQLGAKFLPARKGDITIPKLTTGNTFGWAATENAQDGASTPVTTAVTMTPHRGGFYVDISKQAIIQSDPALDTILSDDGRQTMAIGLDLCLFHGAGSAGAPQGIENITSVQTVNGGSLDWAKALSFVEKIKKAKAMLGELKFAFNPSVEAALMGRPKESGYPVYIIGDDGRLAGRPYLVSNQISDGYMFFGAFNQAYVALWDGLDVTVDALTLAREFEVRITFNQLIDVAVRYPEAFVFANDFS